MALTRKFLASKGIDAAVIDEIITAHTETVSGLKDDLDKANSYKEKADKLEAVQKELNDLKAEVAKNGGKSYEALKKEYDDFKAQVEGEKTKAAKEKAFREAMKDASLNDKGIEKAVKYADWDKIELDADGKLKNAKDHIKSAKEEWAEYVTTTTQKGADVNTPPDNNGGNGFAKMSLAEKMSYANDHPNDPAVKNWLESDLTATPPAETKKES